MRHNANDNKLYLEGKMFVDIFALMKLSKTFMKETRRVCLSLNGFSTQSINNLNCKNVQ